MPAKRMQWSYLELRRRLIEAELWPRGRMSRLACYLAGSAIVLYALRILLGLFAPSWGAHLGGWVGFLARVLDLVLSRAFSFQSPADAFLAIPGLWIAAIGLATLARAAFEMAGEPRLR